MQSTGKATEVYEELLQKRKEFYHHPDDHVLNEIDELKKKLKELEDAFIESLPDKCAPGGHSPMWYMGGVCGFCGDID
jgi:hypothetical protein